MFWWKRGECVRLPLLSSGFIAECSRNVLFGDKDRAESSEPISLRHLATGGCYMAEATFHYSSSERVFKANEKPVRKRDPGADFSRYFCDYILH